MLFNLQILTPETIFFKGTVVSLVAPGTSGYLGILANHAPLMSLLSEGILIITGENKKKSFYRVSDGFMHVKKNEVAILVDSIEPTAAVNWMEGV